MTIITDKEIINFSNINQIIIVQTEEIHDMYHLRICFASGDTSDIFTGLMEEMGSIWYKIIDGLIEKEEILRLKTKIDKYGKFA